MDVLLATYSQTVLVLLDEYWIDLRRPLDERARAALGAAGLNKPFAVISAWPPLGESHVKLAGRRATAHLRARLIDLGARPVDILAGSPDLRHREPSLAACIPSPDALALARELRQDAIFWFDGARFSILWCDGRPESVLPLST
jgi:hypothetical protein